MNDPVMQLSEKLSELTRQAEAACDEQAWDTLEVLQEERARVLVELKTLVGRQPSLAESEQQRFAQILTQIQDTDNRMMQSVNRQKQRLVEENAQLQKGKHMHKTYNDAN
ncbi:MAG: flagellar protein FliT [Methylobacter sp.]